MRAGLRGLAGLAANVADEAAGRVSTLRALQADVRGIEAADGTLGVLNARRSRVGPARARRTRSADRLRVRSPSDVSNPSAGEVLVAGAANSNVLLRILDNVTVELDVDDGGDGFDAGDTTITSSWDELDAAVDAL